MKISFDNTLNFKSRKPEIREADHIQRLAKKQFPMASSTYVYYFYDTAEKNYDGIFKHLDFLNNKITASREKANWQYKKNCPYIANLNEVKKSKVGNCFEASMAAVCALLANGYNNTKRGNLMYVVDFLDKKTGEVVGTGKTPIDHNFAITDMNTGGERNIILDPWFGFADTKEGAIAKYKIFFNHINLKKAISYAYCNAFKKLLVPKSNKVIKKYNIKSHLGIEEYKDFNEDGKQNMTAYAKENYPNLVIKGSSQTNFNSVK